MTTATTSPGSEASHWRWWRDWLLMSAIAVFLVSLIAAQLPPKLMPIVMFPIGVGIVCGLAIRKCAEIAGGPPDRSRSWLQWLSVVCLLLAGFAHVYWIVFSRYLDDAREAIAAQAAERDEREQIVSAITVHGEELDEAGLSALLQPPPKPPTFFDYLKQRLQSDRIPRVLWSSSWPTIVFALEVTTAVLLGAWIAVEGLKADGAVTAVRPTGEAR